jgi:hypothetical protein
VVQADDLVAHLATEPIERSGPGLGPTRARRPVGASYEHPLVEPQLGQT